MIAAAFRAGVNSRCNVGHMAPFLPDRMQMLGEMGFTWSQHGLLDESGKHFLFR